MGNCLECDNLVKCTKCSADPKYYLKDVAPANVGDPVTEVRCVLCNGSEYRYEDSKPKFEKFSEKIK
jgi:hypothetical protein